MRNTMGWAAAALVAAMGCGGTGGVAEQASRAGETPPANGRCSACAFEGTGQVIAGDMRLAAYVSAAPARCESPEDPAEKGEGGTEVVHDGDDGEHEGKSASGTVVLHDDDGEEHEGKVDSISECEIEDGVATASFSGTWRDGEPFTVRLAPGGFEFDRFEGCEAAPAPGGTAPPTGTVPPTETTPPTATAPPPDPTQPAPPSPGFIPL